MLTLHPDVAVVAECRHEQQLGAGDLWSAGWTGRNPSKGLGIFTRPSISSRVVSSWDPGREWFLPIHLDVGAGVDVIGVWAMNHRGGETGPKHGRTLRALQSYAPLLAQGRTIIIGDFNDNTRWDTPSRPTFRSLVAWLARMGYSSVYHSLRQEEPGSETAASLFWQHRRDQPYLVDHAFVPTAWLSRVNMFELGERDEWLAWSDHVPVILEIATPTSAD